MSKIEWTEITWNPVTGCTPISIGCRRCYAKTMTRRLQAMGQVKYRDGFKVVCHPAELQKLDGTRKPRMVFVCSMSDLFHEEVPSSFIRQVFSEMQRNPHHRFQVLTKRADRLADLGPSLAWGKNVWAGVTVEHSDYLARIDLLRSVPAPVRFLSLEPLLSPLKDLDLDGIDWVIAGGESGPGSKPVPKEWIVEIRDHCSRSKVPFFFKQWGGANKKANGRLLEGRTWDEQPTR